MVPAVESPEELLLKSHNHQIANKNGYESATDDAEEHLLNASHRIDINERYVKLEPATSATQQHRKYPTSNLRDISAMSVASIYDREHFDIMDADK